jgi:hypothetical protein
MHGMTKTRATTNDMPNDSPAASVALSGGNADAIADAAKQDRASSALGGVRTDAGSVRGNGAAGADPAADSVYSDGGSSERGLPMIGAASQPQNKIKPTDTLPPLPEAPRGRGRPKGLAKTGGRKKGTPNQYLTSKQIRDVLLRKSDALDVLADIVQGKQYLTAGPTGKSFWTYPSMAERLSALRIVADKCIPSLMATEISGPDGKDLFAGVAAPSEPRQLARAVVSLLVGNSDSTAVMPDSTVRSEAVPESLPGSVSLSAALGGEVDGSGLASSLPSSAEMEVGEGELIGDAGHFIELVENTSDGRQRFFINDAAGQRITTAWSRAEARRLCRQLIDEGTVRHTIAVSKKFRRQT